MKNSRLCLFLVLAAPLASLPVLRAADAPPPPAGERRERMKEGGDRMAEALGLSEEQKTKMKAINQQERAELEALSPEDRKTKGQEIHQKYRDQRQAIMTPEQRAKAEEMRGKMEKGRDRKERREDRAEKPGA